MSRPSKPRRKHPRRTIVPRKHKASAKRRVERKVIKRRVKARITKRQKEKLRRKRISISLKAFHRTGKKKEERARERVEKVKKKLSPLPKGFGRGDPRPQIQAMLTEAGMELSQRFGTDYQVRHAVNADKTVTYELRFSIPRGMKTPHPGSKLDPVIDLLIDIGNAVKAVPSTWVSIGFRFPADVKLLKEEEEEKKYERFQTLCQVGAHFQRFTERKIFTNVVGAQMVFEHMMENRRRRPEQVYVLIHWSREGERPEK